MRYYPTIFGHVEEWRVDRLDPRPPRVVHESQLRRRRRRRSW
jgi:hypothetical protein